MARSYSRTSTAIWSDDDFRQLTPEAQRLYWLAYSQANIALTGVVPYTVRRWARMSVHTTIADIEKAVAELEERRYVLVDDSTEEMLVRTFARHDGVLKNPKALVGMSNEFEAIDSDELRRAFIEEMPADLLDRLDPKVAGALSKRFVDAFRSHTDAPCDRASHTPSDTQSAGRNQPPDTPSDTQSRRRNRRQDSPKPLPLPSPSPSPGPGPTHASDLDTSSPDAPDAAEMEKSYWHDQVTRRPAAGGFNETPTETARAADLAAIASRLIAAGARRHPPANDVTDLVAWALTALDATIVDECLGYCATLDQPPQTVTYLATTIRQWALQRGVTMPKYGRASA
jgi:hypothetical protein